MAYMTSVGLALGACGLPPLDYEGEHAVVGTDRVERVCAGSLARIDWAIEYVDETLGKQTGGDPVPIYVLSSEDVYDRCSGDVVGGCYSSGNVFITVGRFDDAIVHELVHARIDRTPARNSKAIFSEGIAEVIAEVRKPPSADAPRSTVDEYISAHSGHQLYDLDDGYYHGGELSAWLIETHGMAKMLDFMADVRWSSGTGKVRERYAAHFGSSIDDDLFVHTRDEQDLTRTNLICTGEEIDVDPQRQRFRLEASLACDSSRVQNDWVMRNRVFVEWVVEIDEQQAGYWAPIRRGGDDAIPPLTLLEIERCAREDRDRRTWSNDSRAAVQLEAGLYRFRWYGELDGDDELDVEFGGPCDQLAQDCEADELCVEPGVCVPKL
jgi:hypothetical protein